MSSQCKRGAPKADIVKTNTSTSNNTIPTLTQTMRVMAKGSIMQLEAQLLFNASSAQIIDDDESFSNLPIASSFSSQRKWTTSVSS
eukprot:CAMPEP_0115326766 /NCGR_PEP_ID=MMETSP0270-20121206/83752_1 /TAXON_ID=71861 /ORGANISM="Scrippsiella trochoidea, Strain CCMP3099" /LENGTH=85 /DNA_ID=CAMNT_0002747103 /DNA_START=225 /DNA_END=478 /DNA_ORIENTATION=-